jgi:long-chain acyl-CoA synthetase
MEEMSPENRALLEIPVARQTWDWLIERFPDRRLTPQTELQTELGIDSLEWLRFGLEIQRRTARHLDEDAVRRIDTVGDLLREMSETEQAPAPEAKDLSDRLREPDELLDDEHRRWLRPRGFAARAFGSLCFTLDRVLLRGVLRLRVFGRENAAGQDPVVFVPNHRSYLDAPALAAALPKDRLRRTHWGGARSIMFRNRSMRLLSRATRVIPVDPKREPTASLALGAVVLTQGDSLVWFPGGGISRDGRLQSFHPGIGLLLQAHSVPVVPVWIAGTQKALPYGSWRPRLQQVTVRFGKRVAPEIIEETAQGSDPADRVTRFLHDCVGRLERV